MQKEEILSMKLNMEYSWAEFQRYLNTHPAVLRQISSQEEFLNFLKLYLIFNANVFEFGNFELAALKFLMMFLFFSCCGFFS